MWMMVKTFTKSAAHAWRGVRFVWQRERNFRIQCLIGLLTILAAIGLGFTFLEVVLILMAISVVLGAELFNTVIEEILDVVEPHYSVHVGRLKDVTAGVVLLLSFFAATIGVLTVVHHFSY